MSAEALYEALGLQGYEDVGTWGRFFVQVLVPREALSCRRCGCQRVHVEERARREWKSAPLGVTPVVITMNSPKVKCLGCGAKACHQPTFASDQRRVSDAGLWRIGNQRICVSSGGTLAGTMRNSTGLLTTIGRVHPPFFVSTAAT